MHKMRQRLLAVLLTVLLALCSVKGSIHGTLVNKRACWGGVAHFNATGGTITSPLYPRDPPTHVSCSWILHNPYQDTVILSFSRFDLDKDKNCKKQHDCCPHQWLLIKTESSKPEQQNTSFNSRKLKRPHSQKKRREATFKDRRRNADGSTSDGHRRILHENRHDKDKSSVYSVSRKWFSHHQDHDGTAVDVSSNLTSQSHKISIAKTNSSSAIFSHNPVHNIAEETETTGHVCGKSAPYPIITKASRVIVKFFSDTKADSSHLGFTLQYQISNNLTVCGSDEFACNDPRLCVPGSWRCNGQHECPDSSDEVNCEAGCAGLTDSQHCDGRWDCKEGEDELGCFGCDADEWWCGEGTDCYKTARRCDDISDCHNGADELYCSCFNLTQCAPNSQSCYDPKTQRCDGVLNCPGGQDEIDCGGHCHHMIPCSRGGGCYTASQRCDGASQCGDGSDEAACTPQLCHPQHGAFLCANRRCIRDAWRCDQFDDCGDASDEEDCLRNSVIVAAAMGGLVCSLLLVIAVGCTCRLYALRVGLGRSQHHGHRVGRRSTPLAPLSRLEQHLLQREPPPSYSVAVNDPSALLFGGSLSRHWRRQRRRPPAPPDGVLPPLPAPLRNHIAHHSAQTYDAGAGHTSRRGSFTVGNCGARSRRSSEEKEGDERAKVGTLLPVTTPRQQDSAPSPNTEDVPMLSSIADSGEEDNMEDRDDAPLLDLTYDETDYEDYATASVGEIEVIEESSTEVSAGCLAPTAVVGHCTVMDTEYSTLMSSDGCSQVQENICDNKSTFQGEITSHTSHENNDIEHLCIIDNPSPHSNHDMEDDLSLAGDVLTDTKAAVLALSAVQRHTDGVCQVDTELMSH